MTVTIVANGASAAAENPLLRPYKGPGPLQLNHRIVLAPLTRCRAFDNIPQKLAAEYYSRFALPGGMLITEATVVSPRGYGFPCTPGIHTDEQVDAWRPIVEAVHAKGGVFFCQLWHVGRASHSTMQPNREQPISSSTRKITENQAFSMDAMGFVDYEEPRALETHEIPAIIEEYVAGARNAIAAGFDGVEIHGANGYLLDQFLKDEINVGRTDEYGGPIENRCRLMLEVVKAVADAVGPERVGLRLSPFGGFQNATDTHTYALNMYLIEELNKIGIAYVHMVEGRAGGNDDRPENPDMTLAPFRAVWKGTFIAAGGYNRENSMAAIESGSADLVAIGRHYLSNFDLPLRWALDAPLNKYDRATFYTQGVEGYTEGYPMLEETEWGKANAETIAAFKFPWQK